MAADTSAAAVAAYEVVIIAGRVQLALAALVVYEHLITAKYEIDFLFRRKWSASTWTFVFNRYFLLATVFFAIVPVSPEICENSQRMNVFFFFASGGMTTLPNVVFTLLRLFAILKTYPQRLAVTGIVAVLSLLMFVLGAYLTFTSVRWTYFVDPILGPSCNEYAVTASPGIYNHLQTALATMSIILAASVLIITVAKTFYQVQQSSLLGSGTTLSKVLLRDGSVFFFVILIAYIISSIPSFIAGEGYNQAVGYIAGPLATILPHILLSRFIINLRQVTSPAMNTSTYDNSSRFSVPNFRMPTIDEVIGNIGEPLDFVDYRVDDEDDIQNDVEATKIAKSLLNPASGVEVLDGGSGRAEEGVQAIDV